MLLDLFNILQEHMLLLGIAFLATAALLLVFTYVYWGKQLRAKARDVWVTLKDLFRKPPAAPTGLGYYALHGDVRYFHEVPDGIDLSPHPKHDHAHQALTIEHVSRWCRNNQFVVGGRAAVVPNIDIRSDIVNLIFSINFRTLSMKTNLDDFIRTLTDTEDDRAANRILELYTVLTTLVDTSYLTRMINNLYHSLEITSSDDADLHWGQIHQAYPYLWVIWLIHIVLTEYAREG